MTTETERMELIIRAFYSTPACRLGDDELVSLPKSRLTGFAGRLSQEKLRALDRALAAAGPAISDLGIGD